MSEFIRSVGMVRFGGIGADLYENKNGTASIRFDMNTRSLPKKTHLTFDDIEKAESFIESKKGGNGLNTLINIIDFSDVH